MEGMTRPIAVLLCLVMVLTACTSTNDDAAANGNEPSGEITESGETVTAEDPRDGNPVTMPIYDSIRNATPQQAVESLISAYENQDFDRAFLIFDVDAQRVLFRAVNNLNLRTIRRQAFLFPDNLLFGTGEHSTSNADAMLARILTDASTTNNLHVDLAGAQIHGPEVGGVDEDGSPTSVVTVLLADGSEAKLRLTVAGSGRWRVNQIAIDGVDFSDDDNVFVDGTCGNLRVRVHPGAACPSEETGFNPDIEAEIERLRQEAGDDISKQAAAAQEITNLLNANLQRSDADVCAMLQGNAAASGDDTTDATLAQAESLLETTCPGTLEFLTDPPIVPPSDGVRDDSSYGRLDLRSPENGALTFAELFANQAFRLMYFGIDTEAQTDVSRAVNNLNISVLADPRVLETWAGLDDSEHISTTTTVFATLMEESSAQDLHLIDVSEPIEIVGTTATEWPGAEGSVDAVIVEAAFVASTDPVFFLMLESPSGRWRVRHVARDVSLISAAGSGGLRGLFLVPEEPLDS